MPVARWDTEKEQTLLRLCEQAGSHTTKSSFWREVADLWRREQTPLPPSLLQRKGLSLGAVEKLETNKGKQCLKCGATIKRSPVKQQCSDCYRKFYNSKHYRTRDT